jgi:predicted kinase
VNPDSIRLALHGTEFIPEAEDMVWVIARYMVKSLFLAGHSVVVLDATNLTKARRAMWTRHYKTVMVPFDTPKEVCIERALALGQEGLVPIIESMAKNTDPLGPEDCVMSPISFDSALVADIVCVGGSRP